MEKIEFGINDMVQVILTDEGKGILKHFLKRFCGEPPYDLLPDDQEVLRVPLWQIFLIFGNSFASGKEPLFVRNRIQIEIPNDGSCRYIEETDISEFVRTL